MSYTDNPVRDAEEHFDLLELEDSKAEAKQAIADAEIENCAGAFQAAFLGKALTDASGMSTRIEFNGMHYERVPSSVCDMAMDAMECGQSLEEGMALVLAALQLTARKGDVDALKAVSTLALAWGKQHAGVSA